MPHRRKPSGSLPQEGVAVMAALGVVGGIAALGYALTLKGNTRKPLTLSQLKKACEEDGTLPLPAFAELLDLVAEKGVELEAKKDVWPYLLGVLQPGQTAEQRAQVQSRLTQEYCCLLEACQQQEQAIKNILNLAAVPQDDNTSQQELDAMPSTDNQQERQQSISCSASNSTSPSATPAYMLQRPPFAPTTPPAAAKQLPSDVCSDTAAERALHSLQIIATNADSLAFNAAASPDKELARTSWVEVDDSSASPAASATPLAGGAASTGFTPAQDAAGWASNAAYLYSAGIMGSTVPGAQQIPDELRQWFEAQRVIVMDAIRTDFKKNSLTAKDALSAMLSSALADNSWYQRLAQRNGLNQRSWLSDLARHHLGHANHFSMDQKRQVIRLIDLLSAYAVHDPEIGYCQGMSDLALPFLLLIDDDALAFWCFEALMKKIRLNFAIEDAGIFSQLAHLANLLEKLDPTLYFKLRQVGATNCHFAYRMMVVLMRRELPLDQTLRLWEMLWADDLVQGHPEYQRQASAAPPGQPPQSGSAVSNAPDTPPQTSDTSCLAAGAMGAGGGALLMADLPQGNRHSAGQGQGSGDHMHRQPTPSGAELSIFSPSKAVARSGVSQGTSQQGGQAADGPAPSTPKSLYQHLVDSVHGQSVSRQGSSEPESRSASSPAHAAQPFSSNHVSPKPQVASPTTPPATAAQGGDGASSTAPVEDPYGHLHSSHTGQGLSGSTSQPEQAPVQGPGNHEVQGSPHSHAGTAPSSQQQASLTTPVAGSSADSKSLPPHQQLFMYVIAAVVIMQKRKVLDDCQDTDDVLRTFQQANSLRGLNIEECVRQAKKYRQEQQQ